MNVAFGSQAVTHHVAPKAETVLYRRDDGVIRCMAAGASIHRPQRGGSASPPPGVTEAEPVDDDRGRSPRHNRLTRSSAANSCEAGFGTIVGVPR